MMHADTLMRRSLLPWLPVAIAALCGCVAPPPPAPTATAAPAIAAVATVPPTPMPAPEPSATPAPPRPTAAATPTPTQAAPATPSAAPEPPAPAFSYPIGAPGMPLGDGFFMRHGAGVENTWYNPGYWHTGEDWYAVEGDTAGAQVYAIAAGEVLYIGGNYPGRVVILRHPPDLYSMYGHLDPRVAVRVGDQVGRATLLGTVLRRSDTTPSHLHFEVRTFLTAPAVNGDSPRYGFRCGVNCPPGPGYWPIAAPDLPSDLGWRTPTHVIAGRMFAAEGQQPGSLGTVAIATRPISPTAQLWSAPPGDPARSMIGMIDLTPGARLTLLAVRAGAEDTRETSALAYQLWYQVGLPDGNIGWVQAAIPSASDTGGDGRPSSISFNLFPDSAAP